MAGAFAVMMKRRYDSIVAKQEAKEKRERRKRLKKPPTSSENTLVWHWELDGMYTTVMYDKHKREVWCNGLVLLTESILPEVSGEQCSIGFHIDTRPECSQCGSYHCSSLCNVNKNSEQKESKDHLDNLPKTNAHKNVSSEQMSLIGNLCDCVHCNSKIHKAVIKFIRVEVDRTAYELYVDGYMIQEHTENFDEFSQPKPETLKKND